MISQSKKIGNYTLYEFLGGGQFGQVYRAVDQEGGIVAIKIIPLESLKQHDGLVKKLLIEEVDSMAKIDNPNVVKIMTYIETKKNCYLVMEYCGNLMDLLQKNKGQFSQVEALSIFKQISNGMMGLHEKHIMHRDLKLENIFLHQGNQVKIGDLGFSKRLKHQDDMDNVCLGTLGFMAPEVAKLEPYGLQADIFSMGAILYILLYGRLPFSNQSFSSFLEDVQRNEINFNGNPSVSQEVMDLLKVMLKESPKDRITFSEMYKNPLFQKNSKYTEGQSQISIIANEIDFSIHEHFYISKIHESKLETNECYRSQTDESKTRKIEVQLEEKIIKQKEKEKENCELIFFTDSISLIMFDDLSLLKPDEKLKYDLIEKYFDRFNSIKYLLNTLYELSLIHFPSVFPIIYPQMMLQKKALVEFKIYQKQLQANENIFQSTVHEKINNKIDLDTLKDNINELIVTQQETFLYYQSQVDHNYEKIKPFIKKNWLIDNQIEPSVDFNQNYQEAMELIQTIVNAMKQQKIFPLLIKFESHLKFCLNFEQLLKEKVQLSIEFNSA